MSSAAMSKKNKGKKMADPNETSKLLAAKISQLEQDAAGEKDQEQEIGALCGPTPHHPMHLCSSLVRYSWMGEILIGAL